jgi:hypothetical protein
VRAALRSVGAQWRGPRPLPLVARKLKLEALLRRHDHPTVRYSEPFKSFMASSMLSARSPLHTQLFQRSIELAREAEHLPPAALRARTNLNARLLPARDLANVCRYFASQGADAEPGTFASELWDSMGALSYESSARAKPREGRFGSISPPWKCLLPVRNGQILDRT